MTQNNTVGRHQSYAVLGQVRRTTVSDVQRRLLQEGNAMVSAHHSAGRRSAEAAKHIALLHIIQVGPPQ